MFSKSLSFFCLASDDRLLTDINTAGGRREQSDQCAPVGLHRESLVTATPLQ
jgi:hypothetical protein